MSDNALGESPALAVDPSLIPAETDVKPETNEGADSAPAKPETASEDKLQKRFDKLTREKYEALRERDRERWEKEQLRAQIEAKTPAVAQSPPTLESSGFDEAKYQASVLEYTKAAAKAEAERIVNDHLQKQQVTAKHSEFEKRQQDFIKTKPDYADKVLNNPDLQISKDMARVIRESEIGPQIAFYLAENEELAASIAALDPLIQARELGRIEARLESQKAPAKSPVSAAPPPVAKLEGSDNEVDKDPDKMSTDDWLKWRNKQLRKR